MNRRWIVIVSIIIVVGLIAAFAAALASSKPSTSGGQPSSSGAAGSLPTQGPTDDELRALAAELSSGNDARILAAIADLPAGADAAALKSLGSLRLVTFDASTLRFDAPTGAAVVDARLVDSTGASRREREVLVRRDGRWLLYSALVPATATGSPLG